MGCGGDGVDVAGRGHGAALARARRETICAFARSTADQFVFGISEMHTAAGVGAAAALVLGLSLGMALHAMAATPKR